MKLHRAHAIALRLVKELAPACQRIEIAGSIRRCKPEVKDIEICAIPRMVDQHDLFGFSASETSLLDYQVKGLHLIKGGDRYKQFWLKENIKLDLFIILPPAQWGVIFAIRTGPAEFSKWLVTKRKYGGALPSHLHVKDGGIYQGTQLFETPEESDMFQLLDLRWMEPDKRIPIW